MNIHLINTIAGSDTSPIYDITHMWMLYITLYANATSYDEPTTKLSSTSIGIDLNQFVRNIRT